MSNLNRRDFITKSAAASAFATLAAIQNTFSSSIKEITEFNPDNYLIDPSTVYFNHGSIGTTPKAIHEAHKAYLDLCETNPWLYMWSEPWEEQRNATRRKVAGFLGCDEDELAFTHNTTEGFNLLASGLPLGEDDEVVFSTLNHDGASICWSHYSRVRGFTVKKFEFPIQEVPGLTEDDVVKIYEDQITDKTRVLVFPHIDNLVGLRYPVNKMADMARRKGVEFVAVDGAQAIGMIEVNIGETGVDFYAGSPHKWLQTPKGTGLLYLSKEVQDKVYPFWVTWGQERWKDTVRIFEDYGTRNLAEVLTLADAVDYQNQMILADSVGRRKQLRNHFFKAVEAEERIQWLSPDSWDMGSSLYTIEVTGMNSIDLSQKLFGEHGYVFRPFNSDNWNALRMSLNTMNSEKQIDRLMSLI